MALHTSVLQSKRNRNTSPIPKHSLEWKNIEVKRKRTESELGNKENDSHQISYFHSLMDSANITKQEHSWEKAEKRTPSKSKPEPSSSPSTPSTNFKMLTSIAASLDYAENSSESKPFLCRLHAGLENGFESNSISSLPDELSYKISRREKSLAFICNKFLLSYPSYPENAEMVISLDEIAANLEVERRRVYDIVNVLESVDIVRKTGKNRYTYFGKKNLLMSLKRLWTMAKTEKLKEKFERVLEMKENECHSSENAEYKQNCIEIPFPDIRKENSLGAISQKFLMLFLASPESTIHLDTIACILLEFSKKIDKTSVQFKTKIRRLYDIANIFISVGLIERDFSNGKQAFRYRGPILENKNVEVAGSVLALACLLDKWPDVSSHEVKSGLKSLVPRTRSENWDKQHKQTKIRHSSLTRHSSLQDICAVAEIERQKLYFSESSRTDSNESSSSSIDVDRVKAPSSISKATADAIKSQFFKTLDKDNNPSMRLRLLKPCIISVKKTSPVKTDSSEINTEPKNAFATSGHMNIVSVLKTPLLCVPSAFSTEEANKERMNEVCIGASNKDNSDPLTRFLTEKQKEGILGALNVVLKNNQVALILVKDGAEKQIYSSENFSLTNSKDGVNLDNSVTVENGMFRVINDKEIPDGLESIFKSSCTQEEQK